MHTRFPARLYTVAVTRFVDLPAKELKHFAGKLVPVKGTCNGVPFRSTLVPKKGGGLRVAINAAARKAAGKVDAGDRVMITLTRVRAHPIPKMPPELIAGLAAVPGGRMAWEERTRNWRRHVLLWYLTTKDPAYRAKRTGIILRHLGFERGSG